MLFLFLPVFQRSKSLSREYILWVKSRQREDAVFDQGHIYKQTHGRENITD